jgi:hypothetical protein
MRPNRRRALVAGGVTALAVREVLLRQVPAPRWTKVNHAGRVVDLVNGPAVATVVALTSWGSATPMRRAIATVTAVAGSAAVGRYDDTHGDRTGEPVVKGLHGHLGELRRGRLSSGAVKLVSLPLLGVLAARIEAGPGRPRGLLVTDGCLVAGGANLLNLLDLRPGRAMKAYLLAAGPAVVLGGTRHGSDLAASVGAVAALLPTDLGERGMLGDCGANALGALLGVSSTRLPATARVALAAAVAAVTLYRERRSFSAVIAANPTLRRIDEWGRVPRR